MSRALVPLAGVLALLGFALGAAPQALVGNISALSELPGGVAIGGAWDDPARAIGAGDPPAACDYVSALATYPNGLTALARQCGSGQGGRDVLWSLWGARAAWRAGDRGTACEAWQRLDAPGEPWAAVRCARARSDWAAVGDGLRCLDRWAGSPVSASFAAVVSVTALATMWADLGDQLARSGTADGAVAAYGRAAAWYPILWARPIVAAADALAASGQIDEALAALERAGAQPGTDSGTRYAVLVHLGELAQRAGQFDRAIAAFRGARAAQPDNPYSFFGLWYAQMGQRDYAAALATLEVALADPAARGPKEQAGLQTLRGDTFQQQGRWGEERCAYLAAHDQAKNQSPTDRSVLAALREKIARAEAQLGEQATCSDR